MGSVLTAHRFVQMACRRCALVRQLSDDVGAALTGASAAIGIESIMLVHGADGKNAEGTKRAGIIAGTPWPARQAGDFIDVVHALI